MVKKNKANDISNNYLLTLSSKKMYTAEIFNKEQLSVLKNDWERLEKGQDMTLYQSYSWYEMLNQVYVPKDSNNYISIYCRVKKDGNAILIAPFWIILRTFKLVNKRGVYFLGRSSWSDYLNFVYDEFDTEAILFLTKYISKVIKVNRFFLESLKESSQSFQYLSQLKKSKELGVGGAVVLELPQDQDAYKGILSKNTRQNIRTAYNRQVKDGIKITVLFDDQFVNRDKCWAIREERFHQKFKRISPLKKIKYRIMRKLSFQFNSFLPFYSYSDSHFLTTYDGNTLCSFFHYLHDKKHRQLLVLAAGVNSEYTKYSPGFVSLYELIKYHIALEDIDSIDFGVGSEKYKYSLGGHNQTINGIELRV